MEISPTTITVVGVVCVALGIVAGLLINSLMEGGDDPSEATDEAPPGGRKGKYTPVFRVWREKQAGTLVVEMDGKAMTAPDPLNEIQRERLERTVRDLRAWLGMGLAAPAALPDEPVSTAASNAASVTGTAAATAASVTATAAASAAEDDLDRVFGTAPTSISPNPVAAPPVQPPPAYRRVADPRSVVPPPLAGKGKEEPVVPAPSRSIVAQIEDILQDMIAGTEWEQRGLHLVEDPIRGAIVLIGGEQYEGIGAVTDTQVKAVLQAAVQEWEKSQ